ncbi:MAG: AMP-binding protein [Polyangiales bacterium]
MRVPILASPTWEFVRELEDVWRRGACAVVLSPLHTQAEREALWSRAHEVSHVNDALVLFTSGTTATPKAARLTHENLRAHSQVLHEAWRWTADDRLVHALPLHHLHGLGTSLLTARWAGAKVDLLPKFDPTLVWDAIARDATIYMGVPTTYAKLVRAFEEADASTRARWEKGARGLRLATNGSAAIPASIARRWEVIAGAPPLERFGMTEVGVVTSQSIDGPRVPGNSGRAVSGMEVRIGLEDEIEVRGRGVFPGYDDESITRASFRDGWFRTGDAGSIDAQGDLFVHGRLSVDVLKSGGYKLSALEIEAAIREHPEVEEVAVVGMPDEEWGDLVTAAIVPRGELDVDRLRAFLRERLAPYKLPRRFVLRASLPRNSIGKVTKPALIAELRDR